MYSALIPWLFALFMVALAPASAVGQSKILSTPVPSSRVEYAGWLDSDSQATIDTVQNLANWEPFDGWKGWAFGPEPVWLRIRVPGSANDAPPSVLVIRPPFLDQIYFYDPVFGKQGRAGDFFPATNDALNSVLFTFEVPAHPDERHVFVQFTSTSTRLVHVSLMSQNDARSYTKWVEWITGTVWLLSIVFLFWALFQWWFTRDPLMGYFAIKQVFISLWGFLFLGFARISIGTWFEEGTLSLISCVVVMGVISSIIWFFSSLLLEYGARRWMLNVMRAGAFIVASMSLLILVDQTRLALEIANSVAPVFLLWILMILMSPQKIGKQPPIPANILRIYLIFYVAINAWPSLIYTGLIKETAILFVGNMSLLVIDGLVMLVILGVRQRRFREQHQAISTQLILQQEQARLDHHHLEEHRKLLAMLAHEMKTPLANLRIWMEAGPKGRSVMERAIDDMNRVIERCVHSGQLDDRSLQPRNEWIEAGDATKMAISCSRNPERLLLQLPDEVCDLHTDPQMLSIVLNNVLENALKYSAPQTTIQVILENSPNLGGIAGWRWQVVNSVGPAGYPEAHKVFDKYYRSPAAQRQSGSGLGLYLVKSLLELMQGEVSYTPLQGHVLFEFWLPFDATKTIVTH